MITMPSPRKGFTLVELLIVIGTLAILSAVATLVLNPAELLKRARDSRRLTDVEALRSAMNLVVFREVLFSRNMDWDGPNYPNDSCVGQANPRIFVSVPSDNGESPPVPPGGWNWAQVSSTPLRMIGGSGWAPVDFRPPTATSGERLPLVALPVDPVNTWASGLYYSYVCGGSFEINLRLESNKYMERAINDGGDDVNLLEDGSTLVISPPRPIPGGASMAGVVWTQAVPAASWPPQDFVSALVYDNKMWVMGGYTTDPPAGSRNDVWYSTNGTTWALSTPTAPWTARSGHALLFHNNRMWLLGGQSSASYLNDVWYSTDGANWTQATPAASWEPRDLVSAVAYANKMWVVGGYTTSPPGGNRNDVWYSADGINWAQVIVSAPWTARAGHKLLVYNNKVWLLGGQSSVGYLNDVWYSTDGANWTQATPAASWPPYGIVSAFVYDNKMWVVGGYTTSPPGGNRNDVWYSADGANWTLATSGAAWMARSGHALLNYNNRMWLLGGQSSVGYHNDVWYSP